jgi:hypothetical protein
MENLLTNRYKHALTFIDEIEGFRLITNANELTIYINNVKFLSILIRDDDSIELGDISAFYNLHANPYYLLITNNFFWFKNKYDIDFKKITAWNKTQEDFIMFFYSCMVERFEYLLRENLQTSVKSESSSDPEKPSKTLFINIETFILFVNKKSLTPKVLLFDPYSISKKISLLLINQLQIAESFKKDLNAVKPFLANVFLSFSEKQKYFLSTLDSKSFDLNIMPNGDLLIRLYELVANERKARYGYDSDGFENLLPNCVTEINYIKLKKSGKTENLKLVSDEVTFLPYKYFV